MHYDLLGEAVSAVIGAIAGVGIIGTADHYTYDQSLFPLPVCSHCGHTSRGAAVIPVIGPVISRGQCSECNKQSFWQLATVIQGLSIVLAVLLYQRYGASLLLACAAIETTVLVAVGVIDLQHKLIPSLLVYPSIVFALATSAAWPGLGWLSSLMGGCAAFAAFFCLAIVARFAFGEGALGGGDVTLAALIGAICGFPLVALALAIGAFLGGIGAVLVVVLKRSAFGGTMPYGPYLVAGIIYILISGNTTHPLFGSL